MIFGLGAKSPHLFLMLSEKDIVDLREGKTKFVDERGLQKLKFDGVSVSLHKSDEESVSLLRRYMKPDAITTSHEPTAEEFLCGRCKGNFKFEQLFEDRCITCWAALAKETKC